MIKVLHCISDSNIGGAGSVLLSCLRNFNGSVFESVVLLPEESLLRPKAEAAGARVIGYSSQPDRSFSIGAVREFTRIIKKEKPDIVHAHGLLSARVAALLCGIKVRLYTRHSVFEPERSEKSFPRKQISGFINNTLSSGIIAVSEAAKKILVETGTDEKKITVIQNGAESVAIPGEEEKAALRNRLGIREGDFVVLMSARLEEIKGHKYAISAFSMLANANIPARLVIIGKGGYEAELRKQAGREAPESVVFCGFADDVAPYIGISDLILNCSYGTEATSMAMAEAMCLGVPAIASDFGGNPYMIIDGENGIITPQKNPQAIAQAIERLYNDRALLKQMGENAKQKFSAIYNAGTMTKRLEELYMEQLRRCR